MDRVGGGSGGGGSGSSSIVTVGNGGKYTRTSIAELITIAAAATTLSVANLLPANSYIIALLFRVVVAIPTAVTFEIGITGTPDLFTSGNGLSTALNTAGNSLAFTVPVSPFANKTAEQLLITPNATPGSNVGRLRIGVVYETITDFTG